MGRRCIRPVAEGILRAYASGQEGGRDTGHRMDPTTRQKVRHRPVGRELSRKAELLITRGHATGLALWLFLATVVLYSQTGNFEFLAIGDTVYVTENETVQGGLGFDSVVWAFTSTEGTNWSPMTRLSYLLDVELFGQSSRGPHVVNVLLHACNSVLLFVLLWVSAQRLWAALLVGVLFASHPLHVESVAWVSNRPEVLSTFFWFTALLAYVGYVRRPGAGRYAGVAILFALAFMSKPSALVLPLTLVLLDFWPLMRFQTRGSLLSMRRAGPLLLEKVPMFILAGVFGAIIFLVQRPSGAMEEPGVLSSGAHLFVAYLIYFGHAFWPLDLYFPYPHPGDARPLLLGAPAAFVLSAITLGACLLARRCPYLITGWLWFLISLLPVIGLFQAGDPSMADGPMYISLTGLLLAVCWAIRDLARYWKVPPRFVISVVALLVGVLSVLSWNQQQHWRDTETLLEHAIEINRDNLEAAKLLENLRERSYPNEQAKP